MKSLIYAAVAITVFVAQYLVLSAIGWMFTGISYAECLHSEAWAFIYTLFIGWILPVLVLLDMEQQEQKTATRRPTAALSR